MERSTLQRSAIRRALIEKSRPLSPPEILDFARAEIPGLGIATVYRTIKGLLEEGFVTQVDLPGEPPRYEVSGKPHHHHFHCRDCGKVFEVPGCAGDFKRLAPRGFKLESHDLVLYGLCNGCNRGNGSD